jgi:hypothetical protein
VATGRLLPGLARPAGPRPRAGFGRRSFGQVLPTAKKVTYNIHIKRVLKGKLNLAIADGSVTSTVARSTPPKAWVGVFTSTDNF